MAPARMVAFMEKHISQCEECLSDPDVRQEVDKIREIVLPPSKVPKPKVSWVPKDEAVSAEEVEDDEDVATEEDEDSSDDEENETDSDDTNDDDDDDNGFDPDLMVEDEEI